MPSSIDPNAQLYPRVRYALSGSASVGPIDGDLTYLVQDVVDALVTANPAIVIDSGGNVNLTGLDLRAWQSWVGYEAAARYIESPAGQSQEMMLTYIKIGDFTRKFENFGAEKVTAHLRMEGAAARLRIGCIRSGIAARNRAKNQPGVARGGFATPGHRRSVGQPVTVQGQALQSVTPSAVPQPFEDI